ncbi:unnamed protein product [Porites lobata]|uniref:Uncharacterized protein n=1 Tax=Porites lobata TaxID=104759 RepID=A0ABN8NBU9_9CNID|nr:unnamed protein product [Porites lobata]
MQKRMTDKDRRRSASNESQALRDLVNNLKLELLQSQVEAQKVRDQLQCVIYLVRRAWQGDEIASVHLSNIVGVAPPKIQRNSELGTFTATPKSRALNGWARLVIGLLNRMYRDEELELRAKQLLYMRDREELLDEQLMSHKDVTHHQSDTSFVQANTLQLLQAKEEEEARQRTQERERLEQQRRELQAKFKQRRVPSAFHSRRSARKDSVNREAEIDLSEDLLVKPVRSSKGSADLTGGEDARHVNSAKDLEDETINADASSWSRLAEVEKRASDVFLTRRRSSSLSREDANSVERKQDSSHHSRSQTSEGSGKKTNVQPRPRPKTATVKSSSIGSGKDKRRPLSAHLFQPRPSAKPPPAFDTSKTKRQLDLIERDLKLTTKTLQDRLGIAKQGFV